MLCCRPIAVQLALAAGLVLLLTLVARAQAPAASPLQLDRIEGKLDEVLHRLDALQERPISGASRAVPVDRAESVAVLQHGPEPSAAQADDKPGAIAVVHPAPALSNLLAVPSDTVGGFIYTGGTVPLDDLAAKGVRYHGQAGIEFQGWLRVKEIGRYQFGAEFAPSRAGAGGSFSCGVALWLEERSIGQQQDGLNLSGANPAPLSLVLGAELQPGFYKLRLWATCGRMFNSVPVTAAVLMKAPSDLNLRSITAADLSHHEG